MIKSIVVGIALSFLLQYVLRVLPKVFPYHPPPGATRWNLEQLKRLYARIDSFVLYFMIIGCMTLPAVWYVLLLAWGHLVHPNPGTPGMIMTPAWIYWFGAAFLAGWATSVLALHPISRRVLGRRYAEYRLYKKWKSGRALPVLYKAFEALGVVLLAATLYAVSTTYTVFRTERMVIARLLDETVSHPYYDIAEIRAVKRPNRGSKRRASSWYEIEFHDGSVWHAGAALSSADPCTNFPYIAFAAERSRRPITGPDLYAEEGCENP